MIRINPDSLNVASIYHKYSFNLREMDRNVKFKVLKKNNGRLTNGDTTFTTDFIKIGPGSRLQYAASFEGVKPALLKEIFPHIIFSVVLTLLIIAAFIILFKNLQMQQRLIAQKDDFINNVSHELKTPIATVNVALEAFKSFNVLDHPKRRKEYLDIVKGELDRLSLMTDRILNAAVYENKGININAERLDLKEIVTQILSSVKLISEKDGIDIYDDMIGSDFVITGSREHLSNVIYNLLDNAIKYSTKPAHISIKLKENNQNVILSISDHGIGIPESYQEKIFEKFFRVSDSKGYKKTGACSHYYRFTGLNHPFLCDLCVFNFFGPII